MCLVENIGENWELLDVGFIQIMERTGRVGREGHRDCSCCCQRTPRLKLSCGGLNHPGRSAQSLPCLSPYSVNPLFFIWDDISLGENLPPLVLILPELSNPYFAADSE